MVGGRRTHIACILNDPRQTYWALCGQGLQDQARANDIELTVVAQTIVQLGMDLTSIVTRSTLQAGLEYATALWQRGRGTPRRAPV